MKSSNLYLTDFKTKKRKNNNKKIDQGKSLEN